MAMVKLYASIATVVAPSACTGTDTKLHVLADAMVVPPAYVMVVPKMSAPASTAICPTAW